MTFPPSDLCIALPGIPSVEDICLPGGVCLSYVWDGIGKIPHITDMPLDFFSQIGPAMAPLKPFFDLLNTVIQVFKCLNAIPDAITSLDPSELTECLPVLAELVDQLLKQIPQMSIPKMVISAIKMVAQVISGVATDLRYIESQLQRVATQIDRAAELGNVSMNGFLVCAQGDLEDSISATSQALGGIGRIVLLINVFMGLIGGQEIPCFSTIIEDNIAEGFDKVIDLLETLGAVLTDIANAIPDPDAAFAVALKGQQC